MALAVRVLAVAAALRWWWSRWRGYYGGLQFNATTWRDNGGQGLPHQANKATQIAIAEKVLAEHGL